MYNVTTLRPWSLFKLSTGLQFLKFVRSSINGRKLLSSALTTSAWRGGQREIKASETNNYKPVIKIVFINRTNSTSVRQTEQSCKHNIMERSNFCVERKNTCMERSDFDYGAK